MLHKALSLTGGAIAVLTLGGLVYHVVVTYFSEPLGHLYGVVSQITALAPQDWLWATLIGLVALFSLRTLSGRRSPSQEQQSITEVLGDSLASWLELLHERDKGTYFSWRLAQRLAELNEWIGIRSSADISDEVQAYLRQGRSRRTIERAETANAGDPPIEEVIAHLERSVKSEHQG